MGVAETRVNEATEVAAVTRWDGRVRPSNDLENKITHVPGLKLQRDTELGTRGDRQTASICTSTQISCLC